VSINLNDSSKQQLEESSFDFREWFFKFLAFWPLLLSLIVISVLGAWLYLRYSVPVYNISASILVKDEQRGLGESELFEALDLFGGKKIVDNEIKIIQSKSIARQVVENLHLYAPVMVEGRVQEQSAYLHSPLKIAVKHTDAIKSVDKVYFSFDSTSNVVLVNDNKFPINQWVSTQYGDLLFYKNPHYKGGLSESPYYFSLENVKRATNDLLSRMSVKASSKTSTVIDLKLNDEVPRRGEDILNELIKVYNNAAIQDKNILAANTLQFVEERLKYVVGELDSVEGALQRFKTINKITDISSEGQIFLETVSVNDQKISDISMQLAVLDQIEDYVKRKEGKGSIVPATLGVNNPLLTSLLEKLNLTELEYGRIKKLIPESHPDAISLQDQSIKLRSDILENIHTQRNGLIAGKRDLTQTNNRYSSILRTIPQKERLLLDISRQQAIKNNIYTFLLQKREEAAISFASTVPDSRIIDNADSSLLPVSPRKKMVYLFALVSAFGLTIAYIVLRDLFNNTIQSREDIEKITSIPILGEVNFDKTGKSLVMSENRGSYIAEQFRHLRTSLSYLGINDKQNKIIITSSISGEGKSFITANLGISLAMAGKKVVLVELDLRKPKLAESFGLARKNGISNYMISTRSIEEIIQKSEIENLDLISSGPLPPNPGELLLKNQIHVLFDILSKTYDIVLIDLPPIGPVSDALVLVPYADAILYIVRDEKTPRQQIKNLDKLVKNNTMQKTSLIYNGVKRDGWKKYGYGYGYGGYHSSESYS
jgi:capsular exopolysaccharide synthesis family protein